MGAFASGRCWGSDADAGAVHWGGVVPSVSGDVLARVEYRSSSWWHVVYQGGVQLSAVSVPSSGFGPCDPASDVVDGASIGFLVVACWAVAFGVRSIARSI